MSPNPRLRPELVVRRMTSPHESYVMVKDPATLTYYKFEEWEIDLLELLDGSRDLSELTAEFSAHHPEMAIDEAWIAEAVDGLRQTGLIERDERERHVLMLEKLKTLRRKKRGIVDASNIFEIQIKFFDPDRLMGRLMPWIRWCWSPWFVLPWVAVFVVVLGFLFRHWDLYWAGFFGLIDPTRNSVWDWLVLVVLVLVVGIWHEMGHAFACKRFGGEVHDVGFTIFYFEPAFYCRIDDSYIFPLRSHRIWAVLGGPYFELMMCSTAVAIWLTTPAEWALHAIALSLVFITGLGILFNANPLIKLDGYFATMAWLDLPDLRENSFRFIGDAIKRRLFRLDVPDPAISRRRRRIYLTYGVLAVAYTTLVLWVLYVLFRGWFVGWLGPLGYAVLLGIVTYLFRGRLRDGVRFARHVWLDKREWLGSGRRPWVAGGALVALVLLLVVPRSPTRVEAVFLVEPAERAVLRAAGAARVREIRVTEGVAVEPGQLLAVLEDPELAALGLHAAADLESARRRAAAARSTGDEAAAASWSEIARQVEARTAALEERAAKLALRAPIAGVVSTPDVERSRGRYLRPGDEVLSIDRLDTVRLAVSSLESEIEEVAAGVSVRLAVNAYPGATIESRVRALAPLAVEPRSDDAVVDLIRPVQLVRTLVEVDNPDRRLQPGMTGRVQFLTRPRSVAGKAWRRASRWLSSVIW